MLIIDANPQRALMTDVYGEKRRMYDGFSIDSEGTNRIDDLFWVEKNSDGWILSVMIVDVEYDIKKRFINRDRLYIRYFRTKDCWNPTLFPVEFYTACSMREATVRPAILISICFSQQTEIIGVEFSEVFARNRKSLSYSQVLNIMNDDSSELHGFLSNAQELAGKMYDFRMKNYRNLCGEFSQDVSSYDCSCSLSSHPSSMIQEFMICVNTLVANAMNNSEYPFIYRNRLVDNVSYGAIFQLIKKELSRYDLSFDLIRDFFTGFIRTAEYSTEPIFHQDLNQNAYTHFSSPLWRYADVINHANFADFLRGKEPQYPLLVLDKICQDLNSLDMKIDQKRYETVKANLQEKMTSVEYEAFLNKIK